MSATGSRATIAPVLVVIGALTWAGLATLSALGPWSWPVTALVVVYCACWLGSRILIGDIAEKRRDAVDEYELAQRDRVRNAGYVTLLVLGAVLFVVLTIGVNLAEDGNDRILTAAPGMLFSALLAGAAVPTFLLAWGLRTDDADGDD